MVGKTILHYEIIEPLGAGGMGEVYRARDTKLERDVAIKVLPEDLADDPDRLARLQREAKLLAALNHPNIATVHALEGEEGASFLVLELVTGESLEQKLAKGRLPVEKALDICKQIAEALEAAHGAGIIHRDLKPANVLVTPDGRAKVLDFGIAKSMQVDAGVAATAHATNLTVAGTLVGTPSYMSPEQVRGGAIDKRVDIWAFGCLLFETLTARSAFAKETMADTLAAIVDQEPDWNALPNEISPQVRRLIERCLRKDPDGRLHDIADARIEIDEALSHDTDATAEMLAPGVAATRPANPWKLAAPLAVASALLVAFGAWMTYPSPESLIRRLTIDYPSTSTFMRRTTLGVAISPDGSSVVFNADDQLWLRPIGELIATPISDTAGASVPFFSPDGTQLGFWRRGQLNVVSITGGQAGGAPVPLAPAERVYGASWADDGYIYFGQGAGGILRVSEADRTPAEVVTMQEGEQAHGPQLLPGGDWLLFTSTTGSDWNEAQIVVHSLVTDDRTELDIVGTDARYVPTGHIVYSREGNLFAVPFDVDSMEATGSPESINIEGVQQSTWDADDRSIPFTGASQYAFSELGGLVYMPAGVGALPEYPLVWVNREGVVEWLPFPARNFSSPRLSRDGRRIAVVVDDETEVPQIWIYDTDQGFPFQLTIMGSNMYPLWSPDSESVYFDSNRGGDRDVWNKRVDQSSGVDRVWAGEGRQTPWAFLGDGERLLFGDPRDPSDQDFLVLSLADPMTVETIGTFRGNTAYASSSPDGRYFVFAGPSAAIRVREVSSGKTWPMGAGYFPVWSRDGNEIFYWNGPPSQSVMYSAAVSVGAEPPFAAPTRVFEFRRPAGLFLGGPFDVAPDGQRFLMVGPDAGTADQTSEGPHLVVVLNWFEELKERVPTDGSR